MKVNRFGIPEMSYEPPIGSRASRKGLREVVERQDKEC